MDSNANAQEEDGGEAITFQQRVEGAAIDLPDIVEIISTSNVELSDDAAELLRGSSIGPYLAYFIAKKAAHDSDISANEALGVADLHILEVALRTSIYRAMQGMDIYQFDFKSNEPKAFSHATRLSGIRLN